VDGELITFGGMHDTLKLAVLAVVFSLQQPRQGERGHMASEPKTGGNVSVPDQRHTDDRWDSHRPVERTEPGARD